jgi:hypothetical protein
MVDAGLGTERRHAIMKYGGAGAGSRTMLDAMIPAATHLQAGGRVLPDVVGRLFTSFRVAVHCVRIFGEGFSACLSLLGI